MRAEPSERRIRRRRVAERRPRRRRSLCGGVTSGGARWCRGPELRQAAPPWPAGPENGQRQPSHRLYLKMFTSPQTPPTPITEGDRGGGAWRRHVIGPKALLPRLVSPRRNTKSPTHRKRGSNAPRGDRPGCWVTWLPCPPI